MNLSIVQARMSSTRLPGKVLKSVKNTTMLEYQLSRVSLSKFIDKIVVATSTDKSDDVIVDICNNIGIDVFRGSLSNVLERFYQCASMYLPKNVIRITADCPVIDPLIIDNVIRLHEETSADYTSSVFPRSFPDGLDVEIMTYQLLDYVHKNATEQEDIEHVTKYIHKNHTKFKISNFENSNNLSKLRWTLDTESDYIFLKEIIESFENNTYNMYDILEKLKSKEK
ncbi:MAG TPA: glycosyltransferase family protein [Ignavibacteriales bacterium]|nr:glycosyltransferase family protein [Ignavibacteriales bacterium]